MEQTARGDSGFFLYGMVMMPLSMSIADGIGFGIVRHCVLKAVSGQLREVDPLMPVFAALFAVRYLFS